MSQDPIKVAIAHHWMPSMRGGERVLEQFCLLFPAAPIYTITSNKMRLSDTIARHSIHNSLIHYLPFGRKRYKAYLPLMPLALKLLRVPDQYDFILSNDASIMKGIRTSRTAKHLCHCCTPPRYLFEMQEEYLGDKSVLGRVKSFGLVASSGYVASFDRRSAARVDDFIAISNFIAGRIQRHYHRPSTVLYPPVAIDDFDPGKPSKDFYLVVSQLVPYKRVDLAVRTFTKLKRRLVVIGEGSEMERLKKLATWKGIEFLGRQPFPAIKEHYETCRALIFPGIEDFGITPLEAQAAGKPVIAFRGGGTLETVVENETGIFFDQLTPESLIGAIETFELRHSQLDAVKCRTNAEFFSPASFRRRFKQILGELYPERFGNYPWPL